MNNKNSKIRNKNKYEINIELTKKNLDMNNLYKVI